MGVFKKLLDEQLLYEEMSNLRQEDTGLPVIVWVSVKRGKHSARIKVQPSKSHKIDIDSGIPITISDAPENIEGYNIPSKTFNKISEWIILNKTPLLKYWNMQISTAELLKTLKKLGE